MKDIGTPSKVLRVLVLGVGLVLQHVPVSARRWQRFPIGPAVRLCGRVLQLDREEVKLFFSRSVLTSLRSPHGGDMELLTRPPASVSLGDE